MSGDYRGTGYATSNQKPRLYGACKATPWYWAAVGMKLHSDFATAVRAMTRTGQRLVPRPEHARTYEQLYRRVCRQLYGRLQPLYRGIGRITAYPSI